METAANANDFENSVDVVDHIHHQHHDQDQDPVPVPDASNSSHGDHETEPKPEFNEEEIRGVLEVIAATGKFWHDWDRLKSMLSFQLKQVLSEYPEAKMISEQQNASLGETYPELLKRLDEALLCFIEGPPFTLQRICEKKEKGVWEIATRGTCILMFAIANRTLQRVIKQSTLSFRILLAARSIYPNLSKLALALEKNLLVTSTLTACTDPYPQAMTQAPEEPEKTSEEPQLHSHSVQNGVEPMVGDRDEVMTEVEQADIDDEMTIDMEALDEIVGSSETNSTPTGNS